MTMVIFKVMLLFWVSVENVYCFDGGHIVFIIPSCKAQSALIGQLPQDFNNQGFTVAEFNCTSTVTASKGWIWS